MVLFFRSNLIRLLFLLGLLFPFISPQIFWKRLLSFITSKGIDNHSDHSRAGVGSTAIAVSAGRAMEQLRSDREPIIIDKVANSIFDIYQWNSVFEWKWRIFVLLIRFKHIWPISQFDIMNRLMLFQDGIALRTKYIDDEINEYLQEKTNKGGDKVDQLVIIGAGLDSRILRLESLQQRRNTVTYELDFPAMLKAKWNIFENYNYTKPPEESYKMIECDFTLGPNYWSKQLISSGFDSNKPSIWLIEGVTGYLEEFEVIELLNMINKMSSEYSFIIGTFIGDEDELFKGSYSQATKLSMHRFTTKNPCKYFKGYSSCITSTIGYLASDKKYNVSQCSIVEHDCTYRLVKAQK